MKDCRPAQMLTEHMFARADLVTGFDVGRWQIIVDC
jgi:hypothetical protein